MKKTLFWLGAAAVAGLAIVSCGPKNNALTSAEKAEGWQLLFDGKTLDGWRDYNGDTLSGPWTVENGTIAATGKGDAP